MNRRYNEVYFPGASDSLTVEDGVLRDGDEQHADAVAGKLLHFHIKGAPFLNRQQVTNLRDLLSSWLDSTGGDAYPNEASNKAPWEEGA
jgi:hypothetical protein